MADYSEKVQEFVREKDMWLRIKLDSRYTDSMRARLYAHFMRSGNKNLEKKFNHFVEKNFGTFVLVQPSVDYSHGARTDASFGRFDLYSDEWDPYDSKNKSKFKG
jgi:hypothetical protein